MSLKFQTRDNEAESHLNQPFVSTCLWACFIESVLSYFLCYLLQHVFLVPFSVRSNSVLLLMPHPFFKRYTKIEIEFASSNKTHLFRTFFFVDFYPFLLLFLVRMIKAAVVQNTKNSTDFTKLPLLASWFLIASFPVPAAFVRRFTTFCNFFFCFRLFVLILFLCFFVFLHSAPTLASDSIASCFLLLIHHHLHLPLFI